MGLWEAVWILPASKKLGTDGCPAELGPSPVCTFTKAAAAPRGSPRQPPDLARHVHLTHICGRDSTLTRGLPQLLLSCLTIPFP